MPAIDFRQVRALVTMSDVLELLGWSGTQRCGQQLRGHCPVHGSKSATSRSFAVHLGKKLFHCFRCGAGGNHLDLWVATTKQNPYEAALDLCGRLGFQVPWLRPATTPVTRRRQP